MALSRSKDRLFDPVRRCWVARTPEEEVRQNLIAQMVGELGFPLELIAVERTVRELARSLQAPPRRRIDLLVFAPNWQPLLVVECKCGKLVEGALRQLVGYNAYLGAPFIGMANRQEIRVGRWPHLQEGLPRFERLLADLRDVVE